MLGEVARESDVVGRLGGDEFAMLLHETGPSDALAVALRLREALHTVNSPDVVTASFGVSGWLGDDDGPEAILHRADEALYVAKRGGRDRAAQWEPASTEDQAGLHWLGRRPRHTQVARRSEPEHTLQAASGLLPRTPDPTFRLTPHESGLGACGWTPAPGGPVLWSRGGDREFYAGPSTWR